MKDSFSLIPQVFYDLIGRVIPGAAVLAIGFWMLSGRPPSDLGGMQGPALTVLSLLGLMAAYLFGLLLGALGFVLFEDGMKRPRFRMIRARMPKKRLIEANLPFVYDYILHKDTSAGARLAKLRRSRWRASSPAAF
jgi:hypothetical protein